MGLYLKPETKTKMKVILTALVAAFAAATLIVTCNTEAEAGPALFGTPVSYELDQYDDLPMFDGDLETVTIEALTGSLYEWSPVVTISGSGPYELQTYGLMELVIDAHGGELFAFPQQYLGYTYGSFGPDTVNITVPWDPSTAASPKSITNDARCDLFEGTGTVDLVWNEKLGTPTAQLNSGCCISGSPIFLRDFDCKIRVTYTPK